MLPKYEESQESERVETVYCGEEINERPKDLFESLTLQHKNFRNDIAARG